MINNIISLLSKGVFSPALISSIVKSSLVYEYMQADIIQVMQSKFDPNLAEEFIENGLFGKIPKELESYIDYEKIARDLKYEGYIKTSVRIICCY